MNRSGSRAGTTGRPILRRPDDMESQLSGHSSSSAMPKPIPPPPPPPGSDLNPQQPNGEAVFRRIISKPVKRSTSNATAPPGGNIRVKPNSNKKLPASITSSLNSSESEQGVLNGGSQQPMTDAQRSVFLHAAAVADIPTPADKVDRN